VREKERDRGLIGYVWCSLERTQHVYLLNLYSVIRLSMVWLIVLKPNAEKNSEKSGIEYFWLSKP
jgi:hypothetical protein